jgi:hypothetical protein
LRNSIIRDPIVIIVIFFRLFRAIYYKFSKKFFSI